MRSFIHDMQRFKTLRSPVRSQGKIGVHSFYDFSPHTSSGGRMWLNCWPQIPLDEGSSVVFMLPVYHYILYRRNQFSWRCWMKKKSWSCTLPPKKTDRKNIFHATHLSNLIPRGALVGLWLLSGWGASGLRWLRYNRCVVSVNVDSEQRWSSRDELYVVN